MGAKGKVKTPGSGRKKGTPNRKASKLEERAQALGMDLFDTLCLFAKGDWQLLGYDKEKTETVTASSVKVEYTIPPALRLKACIAACEYVYPKRKSIEGTITVEQAERPLADLTDEELDAL